MTFYVIVRISQWIVDSLLPDGCMVLQFMVDHKQECFVQLKCIIVKDGNTNVNTMYRTCNLHG